MEPEQLVNLAYAMFALFWFVLGAAIGSFLNVVVYRLPRGMNLAHPPSRCSGLSPRYPLARQCAGPRLAPARRTLPGLCLPHLAALSLRRGDDRPGVPDPGRGRTPQWWGKPSLSPDRAGPARHESAGCGAHLLTLLHAVLFTCLIAMALIDQDGQPIPLGLWLTPLLLLPLSEWLHPCRGYGGLVVGAIGGVLIGMIYATKDGRRRWAVIVGLMLIGGYLGWPAVVLAFLAALVCWLAMLAAAPDYRGHYPLRPLAPAIVAAFLYLACWRWIVT